jgi:hypothetical protein
MARQGDRQAGPLIERLLHGFAHEHAGHLNGGRIQPPRGWPPFREYIPGRGAALPTSGRSTMPLWGIFNVQADYFRREQFVRNPGRQVKRPSEDCDCELEFYESLRC